MILSLTLAGRLPANKSFVFYYFNMLGLIPVIYLLGLVSSYGIIDDSVGK